MSNSSKFLGIIFVLIFCSIQAFGQNKTKILILGTYHMGGTLDKIKVENDNILSDKRQKEVKEILNQLAKFNPSKIFVEQVPSEQLYWDSVYVNLQKGILPTDDWTISNEIFQLGLQLSKKINLKKGVTCVDWQMPDSTKTDLLDKTYFNYAKATNNLFDERTKNKEFKLFSEAGELIGREIVKFNAEIPNLNLKDVLLKLNSKQTQRNYYYANILALMDNNPLDMGVALTNQGTYRNMNIYKNIVQKINANDSNVLIIYGAGHGEALRTMLQSHPKFEIVELDTVLK